MAAYQTSRQVSIAPAGYSEFVGAEASHRRSVGRDIDAAVQAEALSSGRLLGRKRMSMTLDLGKRIELVSMDPHFHNITIALYRQDHAGRPEYLVHSYSRLEGASQRLESLRRSMAILGATRAGRRTAALCLWLGAPSGGPANLFGTCQAPSGGRQCAQASHRAR